MLVMIRGEAVIVEKIINTLTNNVSRSSTPSALNSESIGWCCISAMLLNPLSYDVGPPWIRFVCAENPTDIDLVNLI